MIGIMSADDIAKAGETPIAIKGQILTTYSRILEYALKHRFKTIGLSILSLVIMIQVWMLVVGIEKPVEFFPSIDPQSGYVNVMPPEGVTLEYKDKLIKAIEIQVSNMPSEDPKYAEMTQEERYSAAYEFQEHGTLSGKTYFGPTDINNIELIYANAMR